MTTKAIFSEKKPAVTVTVISGNMKQYQIALNEVDVTEEVSSFMKTDDGFVPTPQYKYDWNEFITDALTEEEVKADPAKYLDYTPVDTLPEPEKTVSSEKRIKAISDAQEETAQAVQDMLAMQMEA